VTKTFETKTTYPKFKSEDSERPSTTNSSPRSGSKKIRSGANRRESFETTGSQEDSDPDIPTDKKRGSRPRQLKRMGTDLPDKDDVITIKEDIVQNAIDNRPDPPKLLDDGFSFEELLFQRLLLPPTVTPVEKVSPGGSPRRALGHLQTKERLGGGIMDGGFVTGFNLPLPSDSRRCSMMMPGGPSQSRASPDFTMPPLTSLAKDRGNLIKGLDSCVGKLDRTNLSPPPMNDYAIKLNERIGRMMDWEDSKRKNVQKRDVPPDSDSWDNPGLKLEVPVGAPSAPNSRRVSIE